MSIEIPHRASNYEIPHPGWLTGVSSRDGTPVDETPAMRLQPPSDATAGVFDRARLLDRFQDGQKHGQRSFKSFLATRHRAARKTHQRGS